MTWLLCAICFYFSTKCDFVVMRIARICSLTDNSPQQIRHPRLCEPLSWRLIPFTPESDQCQISPPAPPEILHHTLRRTWLFIAYSDEKWLYYKFSLPHLCILSLKGRENVLFELRSERVMIFLEIATVQPRGENAESIRPGAQQRTAVVHFVQEQGKHSTDRVLRLSSFSIASACVAGGFFFWKIGSEWQNCYTGVEVGGKGDCPCHPHRHYLVTRSQSSENKKKN